MAKERSPIKVPSENEDLPDKENAPDFDKDTLQGELGSILASVTVKTFSIPPVSFTNVSRSGEQYKHCMTTLKDIWPVMTLLWLQYVVH